MNWNPTIHKFERYSYLILAIGLVAYIALRAYLVPFIFDEAITFYIYIQNGEFLPFVGHLDANNHLLNSFLGYISYSIFGFSKLAIRLPNVLSSVLFVWGVGRIAKQLDSIWLRWAVILSLFSIPFLIEFFAMARGYGLSMGLLIFGLSYTTQRFSTKNILLSTLLISAATFANLTFIPLLLLTLFWWFVQLIQRPFQSVCKAWISLLVVGFIPVLFCVFYSFVLKDAGALYLGGDKGLAGESLASLNIELFKVYELKYAYYFLIVIAIICVGTLVAFFKQKVVIYFKNSDNLFAFLLLGSVCFIVLQNVLLGVNYPQERSVVYLIPLTVFGLAFMLQNTPILVKKPLVVLFFVVSLYFPFKFAQTANLKYDNYSYWRTESYPDKVIKTYDDLQNKLGRPLTVSGYYTKSGSWANLAFDEGVQRSPMIKLDFPSPMADFVWARDNVDTLRLLNTHERILCDSISSLSLYIRKSPPTERLLLDTLIDYKTIEKDEFLGFFDYKLDSSIIGSNLRLELDLVVIASEMPFTPLVVFNDQDSTGGFDFYCKYPLDWYLDYNKQPTQRVYVSLFMGPIDTVSTKVLAYIWNINRSEGRVNGSVKLYQY